MSTAPAPNPDFLDSQHMAAPPAGSERFGALVGLFDDYRRALADWARRDGPSDAQRLADLRGAERAIADCLRAIGWRPAEEVTASSAGRGLATVEAGGGSEGWLPTVLTLLDQLAAADRNSAMLCRRLKEETEPEQAAIVSAARRCHAVVTDALLIGGVELAVLLGVPDSQLPE